MKRLHLARRFDLENLETRQMMTGDLGLDVTAAESNATESETRSETKYEEGIVQFGDFVALANSLSADEVLLNKSQGW